MFPANVNQEGGHSPWVVTPLPTVRNARSVSERQGLAYEGSDLDARTRGCEGQDAATHVGVACAALGVSRKPRVILGQEF